MPSATWTASTALNTSLAVTTPNGAVVSVVLAVNNLLNGQVSFEATLDGVNWTPILVGPIGLVGAESSTAQLTGPSGWQIVVDGWTQFRVRYSSAIFGPGSVTVVAAVNAQGVNSPINVMDYGALNNATTDDTLAILAAIAAAGLVGNGTGTVYFPAGLGYPVSQMLALTSPIALVGDNHAGSFLIPTVSFYVVSIAGYDVTGTFTLTLGSTVTSALQYNSTAAQIQAALLAPASGPSVVATCTGGPLYLAPVFISVENNSNQLVGTFSLSGAQVGPSNGPPYGFAGTAGVISAQSKGIQVRHLKVQPYLAIYASNPACDGFQAIGFIGDLWVEDFACLYLNGWGISNVLTQGANEVSGPMSSSYFSGLNIGSGWAGMYFNGGYNLANACEVVKSQVSKVEAWSLALIDARNIDFVAVQIESLWSSTSGITNPAGVLIYGNTKACTFGDCEFGMAVAETTVPCVLATDSTTNAPFNISFVSTLFSYGNYALQVTEPNGNVTEGFLFSACSFSRAQLDGVSINAGTYFSFDACTFFLNGILNNTTASYDLAWASTTGYLSCTGCHFETPIGASANEVTSSLQLPSSNKASIVGGSVPSSGTVYTHQPYKNYGVINLASQEQGT